MSEHANKKEKRLALLVVAAVVIVTVLLIVETFRLLLPGLWTAFSAGDEQALSDYLTSQGQLRSFLTLWFLAVVQVLSLVIPAMPVQLAAGLAYGPWLGFVTSFSASAIANMSVYLMARRLAPVIRRLVADNPKAVKLLDSVRSSKDPWFYTILAFITPGLPNGISPYAAANAGMRPQAVCRGHLHQPAHSHPADLRGGQLHSGGQLDADRAGGRGAVQLCGCSVFQPHKAHRTRARPQKQAHQKSRGIKPRFFKTCPEGEGEITSRSPTGLPAGQRWWTATPGRC